MDIVKQDGEREKFDPEKLKNSLKRAGATIFVANDITDSIQKELKDGSTTTEIYRKAFNILHKKEKATALRYSIRRSVLNLGPSGFPFEKFVAELFKAKGYETKVGITLPGRCSEHEVDIIAYNDKEFIVTEAKFHNQVGVKTDTKVALYIKARFDDIRESSFEIDGKERKMTHGILITNTKFTNNAIKYVGCVGTYELISWDHPKKGNLYDLMAETALHPLTCVPQLTKHDQEELFKRNIINCMSLKNSVDDMKEIGIEESKIKDILENLDMICTHR